MYFNFVFVLGVSLISLVNAEGICYPKYGCFSSVPPFDRPTVFWPQAPSLVGTTFRLFTRAHPTISQILDDSDLTKLNDSDYDGTRKTVIIIHGFVENAWKPWMNRMRHALLKREDYNVITTDWSKGAGLPYEQATGNTRLVGAQVAELIRFFINNTDTTADSVYIVGFSLGGHIAGYAGRRLRKDGQPLGRITGLDAAFMYFSQEHPDVRLDATDAQFVDVIHTDTGFAGLHQPVGHIDFFPNGGMDQPGCSKFKGPFYIFCDHMRAPEYYTESILSPCPFHAFPCKNIDDFQRGYCMNNCKEECASMGYHADLSKGLVTGKQYLYTGSNAPFCVHHYQVSFKTGTGWFAGLNERVTVKIFGENGNTGDMRLNRRNLIGGSLNSFVVPSVKDIGNLTKIDVRHNGTPIVSRWYLEWAAVKPAWGNGGGSNIYTACFNAWLNSAGGVRKLEKGRPFKEVKC